MILEIKDLYVQFNTWRGLVHAVNGANLQIERDMILGLIGESGSGKSVTGRSILRLISATPGIVGGEIWFEGQNILQMSREELASIQGKEISLVSQDPLSSLNPVFTVGDQMENAIIWAQIADDHMSSLRLWDRWTFAGRRRRKEASKEAEKHLKRVDLPAPIRHLREYPHQLSGGMRQRVLIAMALASRPKLLIADEPTTALDVTVQAGILKLIKDLSKEQQLSVLYISHDLSVVAQLCDKVAVMYAGRVVESAKTRDLFQQPIHPYTQGLLAAVSDSKAGEMYEIPGEPPDMINVPSGCPFHPRCPLAEVACTTHVPPIEKVGDDHWVACPPGVRLAKSQAARKVSPVGKLADE